MARAHTSPPSQQNNLCRVFSDLIELLSESDPDFRPTPYAFTRVSELLNGAGKEAQADIPYGYSYSDGESGVRVEWENQSKQVRLQVPASETGREYIYHQESQSYDIEEPATTTALARWLAWLA